MSEVAKGFVMKTIKVGNQEKKYVVYVPPVYSPDKAIPAIMFLHGMGESGTDGLKQISVGLGAAVMKDIEKWPFIIIFPQKPTCECEWVDEEPVVMAALDAVRQEYKVDEKHIYLTGLSQGGGGTWAIASMHPGIFAAIAPVCGYGKKEMAKKLIGMPIWMFHGNQDDAVPLKESQEMYDWLVEAGGRPKLTVYPGVGHNCWDKAYQEEQLPEWFLKHRR